eukprot:SAG31_NODE_20091_length_584_cov_0.742268_1_plen_49_part_01
MELRARVQNNHLDVALADKQDQDAPKPKFKAFAGSTGQVCQHPSPVVAR